MTSDTSSAQPVPTASSDVDIIVHSADRPPVHSAAVFRVYHSSFAQSYTHTHSNRRYHEHIFFSIRNTFGTLRSGVKKKKFF